MGRAAAVHRQSKLSLSQNEWPETVAKDERWSAAQRVVASAHFSRSPLLSRFLLYVVAETIEGRGEQITEHQIGVRVFDRPANYRTVEDNIVRNYARQLRKRLADYYAAGGVDESTKIQIPLGGYLPCFSSSQQEPLPAGPQPLQQGLSRPARFRAWLRRTIWAWAVLLALFYTGLVASVTWYISTGSTRPSSTPSAMHPLWQALFQGAQNTYIVPSDAGFNLLEDVSHKSMQLAAYMKGDYYNVSLPALDAHSADDLRSEQSTSFIDLETILSMEQLPEFSAEQVMVRFPRNLHLDDLKNANAIILGSEDSNPWSSIAQANANFQILDHSRMSGAVVVNRHPRHGEKASYASHWNEPAHETYALIQYLPNLSGTGHVLLVQGLDVAGTQAAAETLFHPKAIASILKTARKPNGSLRSFEILLRATSIASNATGSQVVASRIY